MVMALVQVAWADSAIQQAQETLKEQGYYYGQITGETNADTTAAIRRYQIRNGLQVTGELNDETTRALNSNSSSSARVETATPSPQRQSESDEPEQGEDLESPPQQNVPIAPRAIRPPLNEPVPAPQSQAPDDVFAGTPYRTAPAQLQRQILLGVETSLRRRGLYRGQMDGVFGPELQLSLRTYQSRVGLPASGNLDMETLASLSLLPGQHGPPGLRRRRVAPGILEEAPVRGEWIH